jgi:hypothetical protein
MVNWTDDDILALDRRFAQEGVAFHARPLHAAMELLQGGFSLGPGPNPDVERIQEAYQRLVPEVDTIWPGMGNGLAASIDRVRPITVAVVFGSGTIAPHSALGFSNKEEWWSWCRKDRGISGQSCFSFADVYDLAYGADDLRGMSIDADQHWKMALSNLESAATTLSQNYTTPAITQQICMIAELSMKAALLFVGTRAELLRSNKVGHKHKVLAEMLAEVLPHRDDELVAAVVDELPLYVATRYEETGKSRLQLIHLLLGVQFVAASTVRRLSSRDLAVGMETSEFPGPRSGYEPLSTFLIGQQE